MIVVISYSQVQMGK